MVGTLIGAARGFAIVRAATVTLILPVMLSGCGGGGGATPAVPNVVGDTQAAATTAITKAGLVVGTVTQQPASTTFAPSEVVSEIPAAGNSVASGTAVNLVVSRGATYSYRFSACIDGHDYLVIQGDQIQWQYGDDTPVGDYTPGCAPTTTTIQTSVNGTPIQTADWQPIWSPDPPASGALSSSFTGLSPAFPTSHLAVTLTPIAARGSLTIYQTPAAENNWTLILEFNDDNAAGAATYVGEVTVSGTAVNVPNVVGDTQAAAVAAITNAGLVPGSVALHWSSTVAPGKVLSETPAAGTIAASGAPVTLVLSSGAAPIVAVPNVVGATPTAAVAAITDAGLVAGSGTGGNILCCCVGVLGETPAAGTGVASGTTVNLFAICPGNIFFATVPNVVGDTYAAAVTALNNGGFGGGTTTYIVDTSVPAQIVVATNPGAGYQIVSPPESLSVSIVVSLGSTGITSTTSLIANPTSVPSSGGPVTLTATESGSNVPPGTPSPTGTVTFTDQYGTSLCSVALSSGLAACSANISSPDTVTAQYSGDPNYLASAGSMTVTVSGQPFVGNWSGNITSTCGFFSGPFDVLFFALVDGNQLGLTDSVGDAYGLTISSTNPNVATSSLNGGITYTMSGHSMTVSEPAACQTGALTRQ